MSHRFLLAGVLLIWGGSLAIAGDPFAPTASSPEPSSDVDPFSDPAQAPGNAPKTEKAPTRIWIDSDPDRTEAVVTQLRTERVSEEIQFDGNSLEEVFQRFETNHGIPVILDRHALEDLGIGTDEPIDARIPAGTPLMAALDVVLTPLECTYVVRSGVMTVTTQENAITGHSLTVAVYPLLDLLHNEDYDSLIELLLTTTAVHSWAANGGTEGIEIVPYPQRGALIIAQTTAAHQQIDGMLSALRKSPINPAPRDIPQYAPHGGMTGGDGSGRTYLGTCRVVVDPGVNFSGAERTILLLPEASEEE